MSTPEPEPKPQADARSRAITWPAKWAREESFWREVATRTAAGTLALILLGVPTLIVTAATGSLTGEVLWTIVVGVCLTVLLVLLWLLLWGIDRLRTRRQIAKDSRPRSESEVLELMRAIWKARNDRGDPFGEDFERSLTPRSGKPLDPKTIEELERIVGQSASRLPIELGLTTLTIATTIVAALAGLFVS